MVCFFSRQIIHFKPSPRGDSVVFGCLFVFKMEEVALRLFSGPCYCLAVKMALIQRAFDWGEDGGYGCYRGLGGFLSECPCVQMALLAL